MTERRHILRPFLRQHAQVRAIQALGSGAGCGDGCAAPGCCWGCGCNFVGVLAGSTSRMSMPAVAFGAVEEELLRAFGADDE